MLSSPPHVCRRTPRYRRLALLAPLASQGCAWLRSDEYTLLWPFLSLGVVGAGAFFYIHARRRQQMEEWDLKVAPTPPSEIPIVRQVWWAAAVLAVGFAVYNLFLADVALSQRLINSGLWALGSVIGVLAASVTGLSLSEPRAEKPQPTRGNDR